MDYEAPQIRDYGDLLELTAAAGSFGTEDGAGKVFTAGVDPIAQVTLQLLP